MMTRLLALGLCALMVLPLVACGAVSEDDVAEIAPTPVMDVADLSKLAAYEDQFPNKTPEESAAIWEWAHKVVEDWYARYQELLADMKTEKKVEGFKKDDSEYSRTIIVARNYQKVIKGQGTKRATRTLSAVKGWAESKWAKTTFERTEFGGFKDEANRQKATGFFYVKKLNGRWFFIDPLGYPCILGAIQGVVPVYSNNSDQEAWVMKEFGSSEKWAIATTTKLKNDHGAYGTTGFIGSGDLLYDVPEGLINVSCAGPGITSWGKEIGIAWDAGSTYFDPNISDYSKQGNEGKKKCNMVMPVFDRSFIEYMDEAGKTMLAPYANESRIVAWSCANEIPIKVDMLDRYLKYTDPYYMAENYPNNPKVEYYYETYAVTMTWVRFMTGKDTPAQGDITDDLRALFLAFIYDHLLYVCEQAYRKYVPNHLFLGIRWLSNGEAIVVDESNTILARPWLARSVARYSDLMAINWYGRYYAQSETYEDFATWTQGKPLFLTEFAGWTEENTGYNMPDHDSASCFATQEERAAYFEHITLEWMEWDTIIGWSWYRYNHYKVGTTQKSVTGIVSDHGVYDAYMQASMDRINNMAYNIAHYLHERRGK